MPAIDGGMDVDPDSPDAAPDAEPVDDAAPPPEPPRAEAWCHFVMPAVADDAPAALQWSDAHALARLFGPHDDAGAVDDALAAAFADDDPARVYARLLPFVCAVDAVPALALPEARVEVIGDVAHVFPGAGEVTVPDDARAVVLDLTGLPEHPALWSALASATAAVFAEPIDRPATVRAFDGLPFALSGQRGVYADATAALELEPWPGEASRRPVVVRVDPVQPTLVADLAASARSAGAAALVGAPVFAAVAESRALPVGERGLVVRWALRADAQGVGLPDVMMPDGADVEAGLAATDALEPAAGALERSTFGALGFAAPQRRYDVGAHRAALVITHGLLRRFDPLAEPLLDALDARLVELVDALDADPAPTHEREVEHVDRLLAVVPDGSAGALDVDDDGRLVLPMVIDFEPDGTTFVQRSSVADLTPGAIIDAIDGVPTGDWFAEMSQRAAAGNARYRLLSASFRLLGSDVPVTFDLTEPDGTAATVEVEPSWEPYTYTSAPWLHPTGMLDAWDAPEVLYVNVTLSATGDCDRAIADALAAHPEAEALVLDARDRMSGGLYGAAARVVGSAGISSPIFVNPRWTGPDHRSDAIDQYHDFGGSPAGFSGPVAVLIAPRTVGGGETFITMLPPFEQVRFVGGRSSGADGNPTGVWLPGGVGALFVGMEMRFPDDTPFNGIGVEPDVAVPVDAADAAEGRDRALEAAIDDVRSR